MSRFSGISGPVAQLRARGARLAALVGQIPAVRVLVATLDTYSRAGGGLLSAGLAYTSLLALLPGLLLLVSAVGFWVHDPEQRDFIVGAIGQAVPPLEDVAQVAFEQVSRDALPSSIIGIVGLLWGSSRFYSAMDNAFSRIFRSAPTRNELERTVRGVLLTVILVAMPLVALVLGSLVSWVLDLAPGGSEIQGVARTLWQLATPLGSLVVFGGGTIVVYRFVPGEPPPRGAMVPPAVLVGLILAAFAQLFTWIAPRLTGVAAIYGTFVALFALLAWLSISLNLLLLGASWTRVRWRTGQDAGGAD